MLFYSRDSKPFMKSKCSTCLVKLALPTNDGNFVAAYSKKGLAELSFPSTKAKVETTANVTAQIRRWHRTTTAAVKKILAGKKPEILPPLDLSAGTDFQRSVWKALRKIRAGETQSYGEVASAVGNSKAVRAVGGACGANPIPVLIPCHRVLAANKKIGGFSGGMEWKRTLLTREGVLFSV